MSLLSNTFSLLIYLSLCFSFDIPHYDSTVLNKVMSTSWVKCLVVIHRNFNDTDRFVRSIKSRKTIYLLNIDELIDYSEDTVEIFNENHLYLFLNGLQGNIEEFETVLKSFWYRQRNVYLMLTRMIKPDVIVATSKKWFEKYFMVNLVFVDLSLETIYRYNPFNGTLLRSSDVALLYEDFCHNLHGFPLNISIFPHFVALWKDDHFEGRDGLMTSEVLKHINASAKYVRPEPFSYYGVKHKNGTSTGQLYQLLNGLAHGAFNTGPITFENYHLIDHTTTHDFDKIIILLTIDIPTIRNVASVIPCGIWIMTCLCLLVHSMYLKIFVGHTWSETFVINIRLLAGNGVGNVSARHSKLIAMAIVFYCYIVDSYFQSKLMSVLSVPKPARKLETIKEVAESDYRFNTDVLVFFGVYSIEGPGTEHIKVVWERNTILKQQEYLARAAACPPKEGFISAKYLNTFYFSTMMQRYHIKEQCFYQVDQILAMNWMSFRLIKGSPFLDKVNRVVLGIAEAGIRGHWDRVTFHSIPQETPKGPQKLTMESLLFCFYFLFLCLGLSSIVFLLELLATKRVTVLPRFYH